MKQYKKALVTGGAGFIGSHLVERLVKSNIYTISVDNYFAGKTENLAHLKEYENFQEENCDVLDYEKLDELLKDIDVVFHQAASKKTICMNDPKLDLEINAKGTFNLLELSVKHGVKKFVHASTGSVYGEAEYFPQDEEHPLVPTSYYGCSKLAGEKYVKVFNHLHNLDTTVLRYFHIYGPRQESSDVGGVVSIFTKKLLENNPITIFGDGTQQRSFTYIEDVVNANISSAINPISTGKVYNCASGIKVTISELAMMVSDIIGIEDPAISYKDWMPGDIKVFDIDNKKIIKDLNMSFMTNFQLGLENTVNWGREYFNKK